MMTLSRESDPLLSRSSNGTPVILQEGPQSIFETLNHLTWDCWILIASKIVRMFSYGILAVILMIYLQTLHFTDAEIGLLFTLILVGDAVLSIVLTTHADRWGRRFTLILGSVIAIMTGFIFSTSTNFTVLLVTGVLGVISPSGSELGPFMAIELSALSEISLPAQRTALMAWYNLFGSLAAAFGALVCGYILHYLQYNVHYSIRKCAQLALILYTLIQLVQLSLFYKLSALVEAKHSPQATSTSLPGFLGIHKSRHIVLLLCLLFAMDSFGGSFVLQSIVSTWFFNTYHTDTLLLGSIVFWCNIAAGRRGRGVWVCNGYGNGFGHVYVYGSCTY
ncbi:MFS transporter [archaeon]|nr:MAG: MFS transporter [archaeon]